MSVVPDEFNQRVAELSKVLLSEETIDSFLQRVVDVSVALIPACDTCSVSVIADGKVHTQVSSDGVAEKVDHHQYRGDQGPCLQAIREGRPIRSGVMAEETRWPRFTPSAVSHGVVGSYSVPLDVHGRIVGALNLYGLSKPFGDEDEELAEAFAGQAAVAVANADAYHQARQLSHQLEEALKSRDVIGQAKGIIMERERVTGDQAFDILRSLSQARNMKVRDLAERVVFTGTWKEPGKTAG